MNIPIEQKVEEILLRKFSEREFADLFLIEVNWNPQTGKLVVYIDSDKGLTLEDCQRISHLLQSKLHSCLKHPFQLDVSSPGLDRPLILYRQYKKNVGRKVRVLFENGMTKTGVLRFAHNDRIGLEIRNTNKKRISEKIELQEIDLNKISKAFVEISF